MIFYIRSAVQMLSITLQKPTKFIKNYQEENFFLLFFVEKQRKNRGSTPFFNSHI